MGVKVQQEELIEAEVGLEREVEMYDVEKLRSLLPKVLLKDEEPNQLEIILQAIQYIHTLQQDLVKDQHTHSKDILQQS